MLSHAEFATLRLSDFVPEERISPLENWEFLDRLWVGEAVGFSEWLRDQRSPTSLASLSLDLELSDETWKNILSRIGLPLRKGMSLNEVEATLGRAREIQEFVADRRSYEFFLSNPDPYDLSCTIHDSAGLIYVVIMVPRVTTDA